MTQKYQGNNSNKSSQTSSQPLVSVLMPAYNASEYIEEAIKSVSEQTYTNFELLILDDCSTDNTLKLLEENRINHSTAKHTLRLKKMRYTIKAMQKDLSG